MANLQLMPRLLLILRLRPERALPRRRKKPLEAKKSLVDSAEFTPRMLSSRTPLVRIHSPDPHHFSFWT
jgi:hypothetical protein